ncbi:hypothetical protein V1525DRAFT_358371 [Lipomyces kononenkoae]|uniref:Uncharacterized protein n=1 Tax=Lipomyces kononenkoae TaxID=34357 RepID=A0ACC3T3K0_LIPKO
MSGPNDFKPSPTPPLKRSDSLDLLSPSQSLTGSISAAYDSSALSSDDETDYRSISQQVTGGHSMSSSGSGGSRTNRKDVFGGRRLPVIMSSPFNQSSVNRSEYRYLHARLEDDYDETDEPGAGDHHDDLSVHSDLQATLSHRRRYLYSAIALLVALASFVIQTEALGYIAQDLFYQKPFFMLYITHSSYMLLFPLQLIFLWLRAPRHSLSRIYRKHQRVVLSTLGIIAAANNSKVTPLKYLIRTITLITVALTVAASTWYVAVNLTTPSDVTAIYNCSAFFAYAFSVPILHDRFKWSKALSVLLAVFGVLIVAYGDAYIPSTWTPGDAQDEKSPSPDELASNRFIGNLIIGVGAIMYGLYEVLYKRFACPPSSVSVRRSALFANVVGSSIGLCTFTCLWILIPALHVLGIEKFEIPRGETLFVIIVSVLANVAFSGSFLTLMSLTSPVLSSVAALLTIFLVALCDWILFSTPLTVGAIVGGLTIAVAFVLLAYASWQEIAGDNDSITDEEIVAAEQENRRVTGQNDRWITHRQSIIEDAATAGDA